MGAGQKIAEGVSRISRPRDSTGSKQSGKSRPKQAMNTMASSVTLGTDASEKIISRGAQADFGISPLSEDLPKHITIEVVDAVVEIARSLGPHQFGEGFLIVVGNAEALQTGGIGESQSNVYEDGDCFVMNQRGGPNDSTKSLLVSSPSSRSGALVIDGTTGCVCISDY